MLKLSNITKSFGGIKALKGINLEVEKGEIHALLGENGAGKSTLMKVLSGAYKGDEGHIFFNGEEIINNTPQKSKGHGIAIIYQEFSLVPDLSVTENLFMHRFTSQHWINWPSLYQEANQLIQELGFTIDVKKKVSQLSIAEQQIVEIAKALSQHVQLLILDEPSAVLGPHDVRLLFRMLKALKKKGVSVIYISHHLEELLELSDRITIIKDGYSVNTVITQGTTKEQLVAYMIGRELKDLYPQKHQTVDITQKIEIESLVTVLNPLPISFSIYKGEILGIGGLVGSGRTEVLESLFGASGIRKNKIIANGTAWSFKTPKESILRGWGMLPEDRKHKGGILALSIKDNISLANLSKIANRWGFIDRQKEYRIVSELVEKLKVKLEDINRPISTLSGGNQQKVILGKWLNLSPQVLLIDEPTRGVDVGARAEIYQIIQDLADRGLYILMVSSDVEELMGLSDRVLVFKSGKLQGELIRPDFSEDAILRLAVGAE